MGTQKISKKPKKFAVSAREPALEITAEPLHPPKVVALIEASPKFSGLPLTAPAPVVFGGTEANNQLPARAEPALKSKLKIVQPVWAAVIVFIAVGVVSSSLYLKKNIKTAKIQSQSVTQANQDPAEIARQETLEAVKKAGAIIQLPEGEEPNVATVVDLAPLKGEEFFASAELGDKALVYLKAGKAYLYRPSQNKIIEVGSFNPIQKGVQSQVLGSQTLQSQSWLVEIRNGSRKTGQAAAIKAKLSSIRGIKVMAVGNAAAVYPTTQIIFLKNVSSDLLSQIQTIVPGQANSNLPSGEAQSSADVVIILGQQ